MSQNDYSIADQDGQSFLNDLNDALQADQTQNAGSSAPSTTYPNQWWVDDTNNLLKIRNKANSAWVTVASWDGSSWIPYRDGSALGTAATKDTGKTIGDVAQYEDDGNSNPVINHPNMPEVSGTAIVESGSNSDGYWVRYSDGTQVVTGEEAVQSISTDSTTEITKTFPKSFDNPPIISTGTRDGPAHHVNTAVNDETASDCVLQLGNIDTVSSRTVGGFYHAIGTWT
jgi:hypothetical protein